MGRPRNTEARRAQIVEGMLTRLASHGYEGTSVVAIAEAAGLAPGLVHYHFRNKLEILRALTEALVERMERRYAARLAQASDDPFARLDAFVDAHLARDETADPRAVAAWVVLGAEALRRPEVQAPYAAAIERRLTELRRLCAACLRASGDSAHGATAAAASILAAIEGALSLATVAPGSIPPGSAAPTVRRMARALVGGA